MGSLASISLAWADEPPPIDTPPLPPPPDCRYLATENPEAAEGAGTSKVVRFPQDDIFRPLLADPKQPQFQATYQHVQIRQSHDNLNAAFIGFGENPDY